MFSDLNLISDGAIQLYFSSLAVFKRYDDLYFKSRVVTLNNYALRISSDLNPTSHRGPINFISAT